MSTPCHQRTLVGIIINIVVLWQLHIRAHSPIPSIFGVKRQWGIFQMSGNKELTTATGHHHADATVGRLSYEL